ncbi:MAG: amidohydrolase family protein [archaeon]
MKTAFALILVAFLLAGCTQTGAPQQAPDSGEKSANNYAAETPETAGPIEAPSAGNGAEIENNTTGPIGEQQDSDAKPPDRTSDNAISGNDADSSAREKCSREFAPEFGAEPYYRGPLFDAHFHMPVVSMMYPGMTDPILDKDVGLEQILCTFDEEGVSGAIAFFIADSRDIEGALEKAHEIVQKSGRNVRLFLMPTNLDADTLRKIDETAPGLFKGYGEIAFYTPYLAGSSPDDSRFSEIYRIAAGNGAIVMMHPDKTQKSSVENALKKNPGVKFLLHGFEIENDVGGLMDKYPNVYFSLDSATLYAMEGLFMMGPESKFTSMFRQTFDSRLKEKVSKWKGLIKKHPDRFMWGTDKGVKWHYGEEMSMLMEEFGRAFIARLDPEVQEGFAHRNAEELFSG